MRSPIDFRARVATLAFAASLVNCGGPQSATSAPTTPSPGTAAASAAQPGPVQSASSVQVAAATSDAAARIPASIKKSPFGTADGKEVNLYALTNAKGLVMKVTNYGAIVTEFHVPDRAGKFADIVGGYDNLDGYLKKTPYFGATIGRCANRIANGRFQLEGKTYQLATNDPPNHLHGGKKGWDKVVWDVVATNDTPQGPTIKFIVSKDGEERVPRQCHSVRNLRAHER